MDIKTTAYTPCKYKQYLAMPAMYEIAPHIDVQR
jgi:hypothetical protein